MAGGAVDGEDGDNEAILSEVAAVADDHVFDDVAEGAGIDADAAGVDFFAFAGAAGIDEEAFAVFDDEGGLQALAFEVLGELGMADELEVFAVDGHEVFGADEVEDEVEFFAEAVTGDMDGRGAAAVDEVGAAAGEVVHHAADAFFVARDDAAGENDGIAGLNAEVAVVVDGDAGEAGHGFALGAGDDAADAVG